MAEVETCIRLQGSFTGDKSVNNQLIEDVVLMSELAAL